ncbi:5'-3' exonuclease PLD4 isoform X1 [Megalops cyprinoides]|uniref:5'-3' exonuclease PLD4 isoform X1 n=1 Tax=Megalops cyprinoides TaxID=118141 RepID=UPI0018654246|nr:5'-3' exonuclease PLD4 isoform X1 [Megalops cyprinoides]XP_036398668.1 5'-3' exonuclease PLD4 isoform X1 [Megalops cyprinoides]
MSSRYWALHDNYVPNRWSQSSLASLVLTVGCLVVIGVLTSIALTEKSTAKRNSQHLGDQVKIAWDTSNDLGDPVSDEQSKFVLVESIPLYMTYNVNATFGTPLYKAWKDLLAMATKSVDVASFYWTLTGDDIRVNSSTDLPGRDIFKLFQDLPSRNVLVRVATSIPTVARHSTDLQVLKEKGVHVKEVNFGLLTKGILHTKLWIVDMKHVYIGSANMDWRSLTQVKELGVVIYNCSQLAEDLEKIFLSYWVLGHYNASIPDPWPSDFDTSINTEHPLLLNMSGVASRVYISASPPSFCPAGRTKDLDSILSVIEGAEQFIDVSVMEYFPTSRFTHPKRYWPIIEDALKQSAFDRQVPIRLLISCGQDTDPAMLPFLQSLSALHQPSQNISIEVKLFIVPVGNQSNIPYSRVNHNKYMVTDKETYIGTSNWSADYFITTAGVSLVVSQDVPHPSSVGQTLQEQLRGVFERDWNSQFSVALSDLGHHPDCSFTERPRKTAS